MLAFVSFPDECSTGADLFYEAVAQLDSIVLAVLPNGQALSLQSE